jgi:cyclo(L-leucyl-L-leucyl) synthase
MFSDAVGNLLVHRPMPAGRIGCEAHRRAGPGCPTVAFEAHPTTANCRRLLERGNHVLIGVSPFNTQFNELYLTRLFVWAATTFDRLTVVLPGEREAALTLEAAGTPAGRAARRTRRELNRVTVLIHSALEAAQVAHDGDTLVRLSDFATDPAYRGMVEAAEAAYRDSPIFRAACREMSALVVRGRQRAMSAEGAAPTLEQIELATRYVFAEIPIYINTPALLNLPSSVLAYHRPWPIGALLFSGTLPIRVDARQGYVVLQTRPGADSGPEDAA